MVLVCENKFDEEDSFSKQFSFDLSEWQKWSLYAISSNQHSLVTAPTGSGKTLPAEFAISYFTSKGKKVIYTSPIKALSNQKYFEFSNKFPSISFGILTGDIKDNPEADVLIMTTEILRNYLFQQKYKHDSTIVDFQLNIIDLGCVIFDEVHYINDKDRGSVWEESFMMMPNSVQLVMLSATIDKPKEFAEWVENIHSNRQVYLSTTTIRFVPLEHYLWLSYNSNSIKLIKDKEFRESVQKHVGKFHLIKSPTQKFDENMYFQIKKYIDYGKKNNFYVKRTFVLNQLTQYLKINKLLPAIIFVYSRLNVEKFAKEINITLFDEDEEAGYPELVDKECIKILNKLSNSQEYYQLSEYIMIKGLLMKGIAIHHSGIMPVLREMIEILFSKGFVKLLFATETFAVGLNMPTKTVVFTSLSKFDGTSVRYLHAHEYTQQSGRAGRRGFDKVGKVIHLSNLFEFPSLLEYKTLMSGKPSCLTSKFKISYNLLLNFYSIGGIEIANNSLIQDDIQAHLRQAKLELNELNNHLDKKKENMKLVKMPQEVAIRYRELESAKKQFANKKRKQVEREITSITDQFKSFAKDIEFYKNYFELIKEIEEKEEEINSVSLFVQHQIEKVKFILHDNDFIDNDNSLTVKGRMGLFVQEVHCLMFCDLYEVLKTLGLHEIISICSCFTNLSVTDDCRDYSPKVDNLEVKKTALGIQTILNKYSDCEAEYKINTGADYNFHFDLLSYMLEWCDVDSEVKSKILVKKLQDEKQIFLGEFVKSILKINNICNELMKIAEFMEDLDLLQKLKQVPEATLKYVVSNQSLYV